jgi:hypothetical protein
VSRSEISRYLQPGLWYLTSCVFVRQSQDATIESESTPEEGEQAVTAATGGAFFLAEFFGFDDI